MDTNTEHAIEFLQQVTDTIEAENLPAPMLVRIFDRTVQVRSGDVPAWCRALDVPAPTWQLDVNGGSHAVFADDGLFRLTSYMSAVA